MDGEKLTFGSPREVKRHLDEIARKSEAQRQEQKVIEYVHHMHESGQNIESIAQEMCLSTGEIEKYMQAEVSQ